jgi:hypothetical protein
LSPDYSGNSFFVVTISQRKYFSKASRLLRKFACFKV